MNDTTANSTETSNTEPENVVTLTDLQNVLVVLDLASSRGAFRGAELQPVGQLYDKINKFLQMVLPQAKAAEGSDSLGGGAA